MAGISSTASLEDNIAIHDRIAKRYEAIHGEIYNEVEQERLKSSLEQALKLVSTSSNSSVALDFGCGAGNLTQHLTDLGCEVIAADVSTGFLNLIASRTYARAVSTFTLNGKDLKGVPDESVDVVATYSVLHHVPDYLSLMQEFARVLKPGGILYIDHEASSMMWKEGALAPLYEAIRKTSKKDFKKYLSLNNYIDRFIRIAVNPKYQREGDIHVFSDDHIVWKDVKKELDAQGMEILLEEDYLLFRRNYDRKTYEEWKQRTGDMHLLVAKKQANK
jgi:ubiquinone/menaquinone biosynthesis C-methylase UbiE